MPDRILKRFDVGPISFRLDLTKQGTTSNVIEIGNFRNASVQFDLDAGSTWMEAEVEILCGNTKTAAQLVSLPDPVVVTLPGLYSLLQVKGIRYITASVKTAQVAPGTVLARFHADSSNIADPDTQEVPPFTAKFLLVPGESIEAFLSASGGGEALPDVAPSYFLSYESREEELFISDLTSEIGVIDKTGARTILVPVPDLVSTFLNGIHSLEVTNEDPGKAFRVHLVLKKDTALAQISGGGKSGWPQTITGQIQAGAAITEHTIYSALLSFNESFSLNSDGWTVYSADGLKKATTV